MADTTRREFLRGLLTSTVSVAAPLPLVAAEAPAEPLITFDIETASDAIVYKLARQKAKREVFMYLYGADFGREQGRVVQHATRFANGRKAGHRDIDFYKTYMDAWPQRDWMAEGRDEFRVMTKPGS